MESGPYTLHGQHSRVVLDSKSMGEAAPRVCEQENCPSPSQKQQSLGEWAMQPSGAHSGDKGAGEPALKS